MRPALLLWVSRAITVCAAAVTIVAVSSCGEAPIQPTAEKGATTAAGYGRAFGRVIFVEDGKEKTWSTGTFALEVLNLYVRSTQTGQMHHIQIKGDGSFVWPLQAGEYVIVAYNAPGPAGTGRLWTTFAIPQPGQAVYIGDLRIESKGSSYRFGVLDRYEEALKKVEPQLAEGKLESVKALMQVEQEIGTYQKVRGICAEAWGIKCDGGLLGVVPVLPAGTARGYPAVANLTPLLEWKPSDRAGITYDVVVFESLALTGNMLGGPRARGAVVDYAQGLSEPRFQVTKPLQPAKKYDWSVRLREGDTVSTWSVSSYFVFFVIGWASGSGQWFGLSTPSK
jgi:hypothetical protein